MYFSLPNPPPQPAPSAQPERLSHLASLRSVVPYKVIDWPLPMAVVRRTGTFSALNPATAIGALHVDWGDGA